MAAVATILNPLGECNRAIWNSGYSLLLQPAGPWIWTRKAPNPRGTVLWYLHKAEWGPSSLKVSKMDRWDCPGCCTMQGVFPSVTWLAVASQGGSLGAQGPTIGDGHALGCQGVQVHHFVPEGSQLLHEGLLDFEVEGSWSRMASIGKAGSIETALQGYENLRGSGSHNCVSCSIHVGTTEHVENYSRYLWVHGTPLPVGLHCQRPLFIGEKLPERPQHPSPVMDPSVLSDNPCCTAGTNSALPWKKRSKRGTCLLKETPSSVCLLHGWRAATSVTFRWWMRAFGSVIPMWRWKKMKVWRRMNPQTLAHPLFFQRKAFQKAPRPRLMRTGTAIQQKRVWTRICPTTRTSMRTSFWGLQLMFPYLGDILMTP